MAKLTKAQADFVDIFLGGSPARREVFLKAKAQSQTLIAVAEKAEKASTAALVDLAKTTGGEMVGLDFRLKSDDSLTRKIFDRAEASGEPPEDVAKEMKDVLRYTTVFDADAYVAGVKSTVAKLLSTGHKKLKFKNTWGNATGYLGINAVFVTPEGAMFELQFHTAQSFHAKDKGTHALYEEQRRLDPDSERYAELEEMQQAIFDAVTRPEGAEKLK